MEAVLDTQKFCAAMKVAHLWKAIRAEEACKSFAMADSPLVKSKGFLSSCKAIVVSQRD